MELAHMRSKTFHAILLRISFVLVMFCVRFWTYIVPVLDSVIAMHDTVMYKRMCENDSIQWSLPLSYCVGIKARVRISWSRLITVTVWWNTALWSVKITIELKETWQTGLLADNPPLEWQKNHSNTGNWWKLKSSPQAKKFKEFV